MADPQFSEVFLWPCYMPRVFFSSRGRVLVHLLNLSSDHHRNGDWRCQPPPITIPVVTFLRHSFAYNRKNKLGQPLLEWRSAVVATADHHFGGGLNSSSGGELKLYLGCTGSPATKRMIDTHYFTPCHQFWKSIRQYNPRCHNKSNHQKA